MRQRILYVLFSLLATIAPMSAQIAVGDWNIYPTYGSDFTKVIEASNKAYFLGSKNLYAYSYDGELIAYTKRTKLSDVNIQDIQYNATEKYLLIIYENSNIDILYDNGKIVNIPDLYNASLGFEKGINSASISGDYIYVATQFGYMVINCPKHEIKETHFLDTDVKGIAVAHGQLIISANDNLYWCPVETRVVNMSSFTKSQAIGMAGEMLSVGGDIFFLTALTLPRLCTFTDNDCSTVKLNEFGYTNSSPIQIGTESVMISSSPTHNVQRIYHVDFSGKTIKEICLPNSDEKRIMANSSTDDTYWSLTAQGIQQLRISDSGEITTLTENFAPNACTVTNPGVLKYNAARNFLLVTNRSNTRLHNDYMSAGKYNILSGMTWKDITPTSVPKQNAAISGAEMPYSPVFDPDDPDIIYFGTWFDGVYKINTQGEVLAHFSKHNTPLQGYGDGWMYNVSGVQFDKYGNLWIIESEVTGKSMMMLPKSKKNASEITKSDWITTEISGFTSNHCNTFLITSGNVKLLTSGVYKSPVIAIDDNGTPEDTSDDKTVAYATFTDQDGNSFSWNYITCMVEDQRGRVWVGTDDGVVEINPNNIFNSNFTATRLKVPRNDGTIYADYLLESTQVYSIAVDSSDRKWIGTQSTGIFLVSSDGTEVIQHYDTSNSYLPDDCIYAVTCNPNTNSVYIATPSGLVEYSSDAIPAKADFSEIYAYPNPVRPDYTGLITVTGLMDNSYVKITDAAGNAVFAGRSNGGMITWDGNTPSGEPARSGVYFVFASQNEGDTTSGAVTKILIVR